MCDAGGSAIKYLVAIPIPEPWVSQLAGLKAQFRPPGWRDTMEPHITLLAPDRPRLPSATAATNFASIGLGLRAFPVRFGAIGAFERRHATTFVLLPGSRAQLTDLFAAIFKLATWQDTTASTKRPYEPHITLANQVPVTAAPHVRSDLDRLSLDFEFACDTIALYQKEANWPKWQELARYRLPSGEEQHLH